MEQRTRTRRWGRAALALVVGLTGALALTSPAKAAEGAVAVSLTFDDGLTSQYEFAPTLAKHGVKATFYLSSGAIDNRGGGGTMSWKWAQELGAAGHEIGGHTLDELDLTDPAMPDEEKVRQVCQDRARLVEQGLNPMSFAYPTGERDARTMEIVAQCGYDSARRAGGVNPAGPNYADRVPPIEGRYSIRALPFAPGPITFADMRTAAENAYANGGGWIPMLFHQVCYQGKASYDTCMGRSRPVDAAALEQFLAWAKSHRGINIMPMTQVLTGGIPDLPPPDTTAPTVSITSPADGSRVTTSTPEVSGTAGTASGDKSNVTVRVYQGSAASGASTHTKNASIGSNGAWSTTLDQLAAGTWTVQATQSDDAGNTGTSNAVTFSVEAAAPPEAPKTFTVSRDKIGQGALKARVVLRGELAPGSKVRVSGKGVRAQVLVERAGTVRLALTVRRDAPTGLRTVNVVGADGTTAVCKGCLRVVKGPRIDALRRDTVKRGGTTWVQMRGYRFGQSPQVIVRGKGARVVSVKSIGPRRLRFAVKVAPGAPRTARAVVVTNRATLGRDVKPRSLRVR
jgi:peptidoglycan/xylan/chitin deacetylase (PgdA/CDA1 family)